MVYPQLWPTGPGSPKPPGTEGKLGYFMGVIMGAYRRIHPNTIGGFWGVYRRICWNTLGPQNSEPQEYSRNPIGT